VRDMFGLRLTEVELSRLNLILYPLRVHRRYEM
jgi:hypothetical protein